MFNILTWNCDKQDATNQLLQLRKYCDFKEFTIIDEIVDQESGSSSEREGFKKVFTMASSGQYDILLFWSLDRFSREGSRKTIHYLHIIV